MKIILGLIFMFSIQGCKSNEGNNQMASITKDPMPVTILNDNQNLQVHKVSVLEVIQVENYTYLRVKEGNAELWIAAPTIDVKPGDILFYMNGMMMTDFESKELKRKFDKILFVDKISKDEAGLVIKPDTSMVIPADHEKFLQSSQPAANMGSSKDSIKQKIKIDPVKNGITIATLLKNAKTYEGKSVMVRGKVTKYTAGVMGKNWIHLQDGTDYNGKFEIVITTSSEIRDGETGTFEGKITLNKDLGYGYFFEVLMEDANILK